MASSDASVQKKPKITPATLPVMWQLASGALAGAIAWVPSHPFELIKNRTIAAASVQDHAPSFIKVYQDVSKQSGGVFRGLSGGLMRQVFYGGFRLGLYEPCKTLVMQGADRPVTMLDRVIAGALSGAAASFLSSPVEVALVLQTRSQTPLNLFGAIMKIKTETGVPGFWRGCTPLMSRAAIVGVCQVAFQDQCCQWLKMHLGAGNWHPTALQIVASTITGVFYSLVTMPVEVARVQMSAQQGYTDLKYKNMIQTIFLISKERGVLSLYKSIVPYAGRCCTHTILCFVLLQRFKSTIAQRLNEDEKQKQ